MSKVDNELLRLVARIAGISVDTRPAAPPSPPSQPATLYFGPEPRRGQPDPATTRPGTAQEQAVETPKYFGPAPARYAHE